MNRNGWIVRSPFSIERREIMLKTMDYPTIDYGLSKIQ